MSTETALEDIHVDRLEFGGLRNLIRSVVLGLRYLVLKALVLPCLRLGSGISHET